MNLIPRIPKNIKIFSFLSGLLLIIGSIINIPSFAQITIGEDLININYANPKT